MSALIVFALDRVCKYLVLANMALGESIPIISGVFHITYVRNPGGAFGIVPAGALFFTIFSIVTVIAVVLYKVLGGAKSVLTNVALGLVLGGAAGNLIDRLSGGAVVDWLDFRVWPVFNLADTALVIGLFIIGLEIVMAERNDNK